MTIVAEQRTATPVDPESFAALVATWSELDIPPGYKAEIIDGAIVMNPPRRYHARIESILVKLLVPLLPADVGIFLTVAVTIDALERLYQPDLVIAPMDAFGEELAVVPPDRVLLVVEITSPSTARVDRGDKLRAFAAGGVAAYLLVDRARRQPTVTLYTDPADGAYRHAVTVPFGESIHLPPPFDADLDTAQFPR